MCIMCTFFLFCFILHRQWLLINVGDRPRYDYSSDHIPSNHPTFENSTTCHERTPSGPGKNVHT